MLEKRKRMKVRWLSAVLAFLIVLVQMPGMSYAAEGVQRAGTIAVSLSEILDELVRTQGEGIMPDDLEEEVWDEVGDGTIVLQRSRSEITYLVVVYGDSTESALYENGDRSEIINSINRISVVFINGKDKAQEFAFEFETDDLCEVTYEEALMTVMELNGHDSDRAVAETGAAVEEVPEAGVGAEGENGEVEEDAESEGETEKVEDDAESEDETGKAEDDAESEDETGKGEDNAELEGETGKAEGDAESEGETGNTGVGAESEGETGNADDNTELKGETEKEETDIESEDENAEVEPEVTFSENIVPVVASALTELPAGGEGLAEEMNVCTNGRIRIAGNSISVMNLHLIADAPEVRYQAYMESGIIYINEDGEQYAAYCYNRTKKTPVVKEENGEKKYPLYGKYDYHNLPDDYKEHLGNGQDVFGDQDLMSRVSMLMAAGYPNDAMGLMAKTGVDRKAAYLETQALLHCLLDPIAKIEYVEIYTKEVYERPMEELKLESLFVECLKNNAEKYPAGKYAYELYMIAMEGYQYDFNFELEGKVIFQEAANDPSGYKYQTGVLTSSGNLNGYFTFASLPGGMKAVDLEGNDMEGQEIKVGQAFRLVSAEAPEVGDILGIELTFNQAEPMIYYYQPEENKFQNLIRLQLSDLYEEMTINIHDVIKTEEEPQKPGTPSVPGTSTGSGNSGSSVVTIREAEVPLAPAPSELVQIDHEEIPMAALPKTGRTTMADKLFLLSSVFGGVWLAIGLSVRKRSASGSHVK